MTTLTATPGVRPRGPKTAHNGVERTFGTPGAEYRFEDQQRSVIPFPDGTPEDLATVLTEASDSLKKYVHFADEEQVWAVTLWIAHTYLLDGFDVSPRLAIRAPSKQSGKTRLMEVARELVKSGWHVVGPSAAVLFRSIEQQHPSILLDEADRFFERRAEDSADVLQLLNAGHARGSTVPRVEQVSGKWTVKNFEVFAAVALAGIGTEWPDTVMDRAVIVNMEKKTSAEPVERFRRPQKAELALLGNRLQHSLTRVTEFSFDDLPEELSDRAQDGWEPLLAIAAAAGPDWLAKARQAAIKLSGQGAWATDERPEILALRDMRAVFEREGDPEFLTSETLLFGLLANKEAPWDDGPQPLSYHKLGKLMGKFNVKSHQPVKGGRRGYYLADIERHWDRLKTTDEPLAGLVTPIQDDDLGHESND